MRLRAQPPLRLMAHDVTLVFLAEPAEDPDGRHEFVDLGTEPALPFRLPILDLIVDDAGAGWPTAPRWLGNIWA